MLCISSLKDLAMESFSSIQENVKDNITKARVNFKKSPKDRITVSYVETRLEALEAQWQSFCDTHRQILSEVKKAEWLKSSYVQNTVYDVAEDMYIEYKTDLKEALLKLDNTVDLCKKIPINEKSYCSVKLPKISIPTFSGRYTEWTSFRDLFVSLIDKNKSLDDVQKLHYLKSHLSGEAERLLRHIPITENNYKVCWTQLKGRYDNKKYLSNQILRRLMSQRVLQTESSSSTKELLDTMNECLSALQNLEIDISSWDIIVIYIMSQKLDPESRKQWESKANESDGLPTLSTFREFLEHKFRSLEFLDNKPKPKVNVSVNKNNVFHVSQSGNSQTSSMDGKAVISCPFCKANHRLNNCKLFANKDYDARHDFVQTNRLCYNCLGLNHSVFSCRQLTRCRICSRKHHSLLHPKTVSQLTDNVDKTVDKKVVASTATTSQDGVTDVVTCFSNIHSQVLLATALVDVETRAGNDLTFRCLLDQGSQASFITESAVQTLGLQKVPNKICISGVGGSDQNDSLESRYMVSINLKSLNDPTFVITVKAHVLNKLTTFLPSKKVVLQFWSGLPGMRLADPMFDTPNKIDLLLGAKVYGQILVEGLIKGPPGSPVAQNTRLGWILSGQIHSEPADDSENCHSNTAVTVVSMHAECNENELLRKFWELESDQFSGNDKKMLTLEEQKCEEVFMKTTTRDDSGRYIVKLPFRDDDPKCIDGDSKDIAAKRLHLLEKRLSRNPELKQQYSDVMKEYIELRHMELVPEEQRDKPDVVYLPHHAVVREDKKTTKVRVVFDASCPGKNGVSLNSELMVGPTLQPDLRHIVMRWRQYPISLVADIVKMYRQVKVTESDSDFQRILWRDETGSLQHYRLLRITFGTASAPYLAVRALQQLAHDEGEDLKAASERVLRDFYMDDLMTGCQTVEEGLKIYKEINEMMIRGGFELQKWVSSDGDLLERMGKVKGEQEGKLEIGSEKESEKVMKVLGLTWNNATDEFEYSVQLPPLSTPVTKRKVISDISRLFDPLGWIAPTIIMAKIFIQKLWVSGIDWDQELPSHLLQEWITYRDDLSQLTDFRIPRWIHTKEDDESVELHGFCDASNNAIAAVVYTRTTDKDGEVHVNMVTSKTKVSPIKQVSIPRLELCGAQLLAKLLMEVSQTLNISKNHIHAWTDSSVVLAWLSSHPSRWKTFVANRVSEILTVMDRSQWSHVRSKDNPADCASRGVKASDCSSLSLWKEGPSWLKNEVTYSPLDQGSQEISLEERAKKVSCATTCDDEGDELFDRFSSLRKLIRVIAFCRRFFQLTHSQIKPKFPVYLTSTELQSALNVCITQCQHRHFKDEIDGIAKTGTVNKKSKLASFNPFIDKNSILRVGGRLQKADISENMKHPILVPRKSHLADLIVADAHEKTLHGGPQLMLNYIRSKYWILDAKNLVKCHVRKCVVCLRHSSRTNHPIMGQLPEARVTACRPFSQSGVDYAGPIAIRTTKGRGHRSTKGYICLFICMATRAIHLEAVSDMTSEGFLAAFKRFVARRGHCANLWSDNGSNFVGAARELKELLVEESSGVAVEIADWLATNGTTWHRIPPYTPNFGGLWEAGIKSTKHHLKRVIGTSTLTFEEITTVLSQIEACLNSRPLS